MIEASTNNVYKVTLNLAGVGISELVLAESAPIAIDIAEEKIKEQYPSDALTFHSAEVIAASPLIRNDR